MNLALTGSQLSIKYLVNIGAWEKQYEAFYPEKKKLIQFTIALLSLIFHEDFSSKICGKSFACKVKMTYKHKLFLLTIDF